MFFSQKKTKKKRCRRRHLRIHDRHPKFFRDENENLRNTETPPQFNCPNRHIYIYFTSLHFTSLRCIYLPYLLSNSNWLSTCTPTTTGSHPSSKGSPVFSLTHFPFRLLPACLPTLFHQKFMFGVRLMGGLEDGFFFFFFFLKY